LAKIAAEKYEARSHAPSAQVDQLDHEVRWRDIHAAYVYLCKIKHPTMPSVMHDSQSAAEVPGTFFVMAVPDTRLDDLPIKAAVLTIATHRLLQSIRDFLYAQEQDSKDERVRQVKLGIRRCVMMMQDAFRNRAPLPFSAGLDPRAEAWARAKQRQEDCDRKRGVKG